MLALIAQPSTWAEDFGVGSDVSDACDASSADEDNDDDSDQSGGDTDQSEAETQQSDASDETDGSDDTNGSDEEDIERPAGDRAADADADAARQFLMIYMDLCDRCARHSLEAAGPHAAPLNCDCGGGAPRTRCVCDDVKCPYALTERVTMSDLSVRMRSAVRRFDALAQRRSACACCGAPPQPGHAYVVNAREER